MAGLALVMSVPMLDSGLVSASPTPPPAPTSSEVTTAPTTYTVKSGDSLAGIANRYGVGLSALLKANSLTVSSMIHPGDTLTLPAGARTVPVATSSSTPKPGAASNGDAATASTTGTTTTGTTTTGTATTGTTITYVVKSGDALAGIAWKHGVKLGALVKANGLTTTSMIYPGQTLTIPPATMPIPATASTASAAAGTATPAAVASPAGGSGTTASTATATPAANPSIDTVLTFLRAQVGVGYKFFSAGPDAYDCSGLVVAGWKQIGVNLPHQSQALATKGTAIDWLTAPIQPGDLVFTSAYGDPARITHVGIALSDTTWIQAVGAGRTVTIGSLPADAKILAVRRLA